MVVDTGSKFWKLENGIWRVNDSMTRQNGWQMSVERKKDGNGKIIQYSSRDWFQQGKNPGGAQWNPEGDGFKGNKAKAWTKGVVGVLTGNEKITNAALHGSTDEFLKSTGEGMSDAELAINLSVIGAGVVGGIASSRAGVRSGHAEAGNLKALRTKYKISKAQLIEQSAKDKVDISKVSEFKINSFIEEWNKRDPVDNVKVADAYYEKVYQDLNTKQRTHLNNKPVWKGGSWDRAQPSEKASFTAKWNAWKATKARLSSAIERAGNKFSRIRQDFNRLKAERDRITKERGKKAAEDAVKKFETDNSLKPLTFMEYLQEFKKVYNKNPTEAELAEFKITFNKFRVDLKNVDSAIRETATENYKAAGESDPTSTYFRMWEDIKSKNNGKIDLKAFEDEIKTESLEARNSARASRIKQFEEQHGLKKMTIEEYIYKYQENNNGYRPNRAQLKKFIADYNDYRVDLNSISESTKAKIMEDYEAAGTKTPNLYEVWEVNKAKGGTAKTFEEALLKDAAQAKRATLYTEKIAKLRGLDKNEDGKLTKEEVKEFNKKFDFDADGILGKEEKAAKAKEIQEKYPDLDAEERRLLEDDEVEVDLFGEGEGRAPPKKGSGKATKAAAGATAGGVIAGAVAGAVASSKSGGDSEEVDKEKILPDNLPQPRRRIIEFPDIYQELLKIFGNEYYYPNQQPKTFTGWAFKSQQYPHFQNTKSPFIQDIPANNPFDIGGNEVPIRMNNQPYHPDITRKKAHELLLKSFHSYDDSVDHNSVLIENTEGTLDVQVKIFTEAMYKVVAFRGTETTMGVPSSLGDILTDVNTFSARLSQYFPFIQAKDDLIAHQGFLRSLAFVYDKIKLQLEGVENFEITGHSMGGAMGSIFAYVYSIDTNKYPVHAFVFGSPRVFIGDVENYNKRIDLVRFQNTNDGATFVPTQEFSAQGGIAAGIGMVGAMQAAKRYSQPNTGMLQTAGALAAVGASYYTTPLPFKHVGLGIMLFRDKNEVVNLRESKDNPGMRVVQENYLFIPEGEDILRNPINIEGLIVKSVWDTFSGRILTKAVLGSGGFEDPVFNTLFKTYKDDSKFGNSFIKSAYGFYQAFMDSNSILMSNKYTDTLLNRVKKYRARHIQLQAHRDPIVGLEADFNPMPLGILTAENLKKMGQDILSTNMAFLSRPEVDRLQYYQESTSILEYAPDGSSLQQALYGEYIKDIKILINKYFREQKTSDFFYLRDCFARFHIYSMIVGVKLSSQAITAYNHFDGHLVSTYLERIDELPDIIYSGQNIPETITDTM